MHAPVSLCCLRFVLAATSARCMVAAAWTALAATGTALTVVGIQNGWDVIAALGIAFLVCTGILTCALLGFAWSACAVRASMMSRSTYAGVRCCCTVVSKYFGSEYSYFFVLFCAFAALGSALTAIGKRDNDDVCMAFKIGILATLGLVLCASLAVVCQCVHETVAAVVDRRARVVATATASTATATVPSATSTPTHTTPTTLPDSIVVDCAHAT